MALITGYVAYGTGNLPSNFTELSGGSYARVAATYVGSVAGGTLSATTTVAPPATGTYNAIAIFDASTGGDMLFFSPLSTPASYTSGSTIPALSQTVTWSDGLTQDLETSGYVFAPSSEVASLGNSQGLFIGTSAVFLSGAGSLVAGGGTIYVPSYVGTPTDVPLPEPGLVPMRIDPVNNKLWAYVSGAWKGVALT